MVYSPNNVSAKNYQKWLILVEVIVSNTSVVFLRHSVLIPNVIKICTVILGQWLRGGQNFTIYVTLTIRFYNSRDTDVIA